jgi:hypothetical protein
MENCTQIAATPAERFKPDMSHAWPYRELYGKPLLNQLWLIRMSDKVDQNMKNAVHS